MSTNDGNAKVVVEEGDVIAPMYPLRASRVGPGSVVRRRSLAVGTSTPNGTKRAERISIDRYEVPPAYACIVHVRHVGETRAATHAAGP